MGFIELFAIAVGLSMDAFAVAVCKGLCTKRANLKHFLLVGLWFGGFQALMPFIGYWVGSLFSGYIEAYDHWVAFALLSLIGINMLREAFSKEDEECSCSREEKNEFSPMKMFVLAIATSIDALAVGIALSFDLAHNEILPAVLLVGVVTFVLSVVGVKVGNVFGTKYKSKAEIAGGIILIGIGLKILLEGIGVI